MSSVLKEGWFEARGIPANTSTQFLPVLEMIANPTSVISVFFDTSLKSWVLLLRVQPGNSTYVNLSGVEQLDFLLKIAIITEENDQVLPQYRIFTKKQSESLQSFAKEADLQQKVSIDSSRYNSDEICPPVTSFAFFPYDPSKNIDNATAFLSILKNKVISQRSIPMTQDELYKAEQVNSLIDYLRPLVMKHKFKVLPLVPEITILALGVIVMPREVESITISNYIRDLNGGPISYKVLAQQVASVLRLVIKQKVMAFDLHGNNQLIHRNTLSVKIIDFGRSRSLMRDDFEDGDEDFLTNRQKIDAYEEINKGGGYEAQLNYLESHIDTSGQYNDKNVGHKKICETILEILLWIRTNELMGVKQRFGKSNPVSKMSFIENIEQMRRPEDRCRTLYEAFKIFKSSNAIKDDSLTHRKIIEFIEEGKIIGFGGVDPNDFICTIPPEIGSFRMETTEPPDTYVSSAQGAARSYLGSSDSATVIATTGQNAGPQLAVMSSSSQDKTPGSSFFKSFGGFRMRTKSKSYRNAAPKYVKNRTKYLTSKHKRKTRKPKKQMKTRKPKK